MFRKIFETIIFTAIGKGILLWVDKKFGVKPQEWIADMLGGMSIGAIEYILLGFFGLFSMILWEYFEISKKICDKLVSIRSSKIDNIYKELDTTDIESLTQTKYNSQNKTFSYKNALTNQYNQYFTDPKYQDYKVIYNTIIESLDTKEDHRISLEFLPKNTKKVELMFFVPKDWCAKIFICKQTNDNQKREIDIFSDECVSLEKDCDSKSFIRFRIEYDKKTASKIKYGSNHSYLFVFLKSFTL